VIRTFLHKLLQLVPVLLIVSFLTLALLELVPGDPSISILGADAPAAEYERVREQLGLDQPLLERYGNWLSDAVSGDLGDSAVRPGVSVWSLIASRLPVTLQITVMALGLALLVSIPVGVAAAARVGSRFDRGVGTVTSGLISIPQFVAGLLIVQLFVFNPDVPRIGTAVLLWFVALTLLVNWCRRFVSDREGGAGSVFVGCLVLGLGLLAFFWWPSFPRQGFSRLTGDDGLAENLRTTFLPALTVAMSEIAVFTRLLRSDMISTLQEDYILAANAQGKPLWRILFRDALRPSSFSLMTVAGVSLGRLIGGTVIVETIFNLPGMGRLIIQEGVIVNDFPIVQGGVLVIALFYVVLNALVDISYAALDPRIRRGVV
jgi:peptide/nickel transport system permease protein